MIWSRQSPESFRQTMWTDEEMLDALHMRASGMTTPEIGKELGRSKCSVIGLLNRINRETDATDNGNQNGTLPPKWWAQRKENAA